MYAAMSPDEVLFPSICCAWKNLVWLYEESLWHAWNILVHFDHSAEYSGLVMQISDFWIRGVFFNTLYFCFTGRIKQYLFRLLKVEKMRQAQIWFIITVHFLPYIGSERCFSLALLSEDCDGPEHSAKAIIDVDYTHIFLVFDDKYAVCIPTGISMCWFTQKMKIQEFKSSAGELCVSPARYLLQLKEKKSQYFYFNKTIGFHPTFFYHANVSKMSMWYLSKWDQILKIEVRKKYEWKSHWNMNNTEKFKCWNCSTSGGL